MHSDLATLLGRRPETALIDGTLVFLNFDDSSTDGVPLPMLHCRLPGRMLGAMMSICSRNRHIVSVLVMGGCSRDNVPVA
jgi:hypothetical protein